VFLSFRAWGHQGARDSLVACDEAREDRWILWGEKMVMSNVVCQCGDDLWVDFISVWLYIMEDGSLGCDASMDDRKVRNICTYTWLGFYWWLSCKLTWGKETVRSDPFNELRKECDWPLGLAQNWNGGWSDGVWCVNQMFERCRMLLGIILDLTWRVEHESLACSVDIFDWHYHIGFLYYCLSLSFLIFNPTSTLNYCFKVQLTPVYPG
jgi:hypothetical protein